MLSVKITFSLFLIAILASIGHAQTKSAPYSPCISAPPLPLPTKNFVTVGSEPELYAAMKSLKKDMTVLIKPGRYQLRDTLGITVDNVTVRGLHNDCGSVELIGNGMDNVKHGGVEHGFWINASNTTIANLTISEVYFHTIQIEARARAPHIYNVRLVNSGQQFIKSNPKEYGQGVDNGVVEYSIMEYSDGPPVTNHDNSGIGYTNGVDIHAGSGWRISNNRFRNFHTPDNADHLWNAAVLTWNGAVDTITENNVFIDVDRAIAYGLNKKNYDHKGGVIRNNMIVLSKKLFSSARARAADAPIIIWDSPGTKVIHNTVLTNGNMPNAIELRFESANIEVTNNLTDAAISHRDRKFFLKTNNLTTAKPNWFKNLLSGDLRLTPDATEALNQTRRHRFAETDVDGEKRPFGRKVDLGADELNQNSG